MGRLLGPEPASLSLFSCGENAKSVPAQRMFGAVILLSVYGFSRVLDLMPRYADSARLRHRPSFFFATDAPHAAVCLD